MSAFHGPVWTPDGIVDGAVEVDDVGVVVDVRPRRNGDPGGGGLLVPGLVNAHTHLELAGLTGRVPGGEGFLPWVQAFFAASSEDAEAPARAARAMADAGTAWVWDVSNAGDTAPVIEAAGLRGVVQHEVLGFDRADVAARIAAAPSLVRDGVVPVRPTPHALFSTAPALVEALVEASPLGATVHIGEAEHEAAFVASGTGPMADLLDHLGRDWRWWHPHGLSPVGVLDGLGLLGPGLLLVHAVRLSADDLALAAAKGAPVCLCPRSNLHIGGRLPDLDALLASGVRLAVGTDSLASSPDVDVLGEVHTLAATKPEAASRWLAAATHEGADALGAPVGRLQAGARGGVLELDLADPTTLAERVPDRRWCVRPS